MPGPEQAPIEMELAEVEKPDDDGCVAVAVAENVVDGGVIVTEVVTRREKRERGKAHMKRKDCFAYAGAGGVAAGSSSSSSSNTGSSCSESSEVEQQERQRQIDQWNLRRPVVVMEVNDEAVKRQRRT